MSDLERRIADLPPEKRELLERLLRDARSESARRAERRSTVSDVTTATSPALTFPAGIHGPLDDARRGKSPQAIKGEYRTLYNAVSNQLNAGPFGQHAFFCNFGYVPDASPQHARVDLPDRMLNRNTVRLVLEVIGDRALDGRRVLDVGCGRGGTIWVIARYFQPRQLVGLDLSSSAIRFDARTHRSDHVAFLEGDAEALPFRSDWFDVVSNVESSHSYPDIDAFYGEVSRVLRPGGAFVYTDVFSPAAWDDHVARLEALGLRVERTRDITANVLRSCDETAGEKRGAYRTGNDSVFMGNFLGTPDSEVYRLMKSGDWAYRILALSKPHAFSDRHARPRAPELER